MKGVKRHHHITIADKNGNEFYVIPAEEFQPQPSRKESILAVIGTVAIGIFFLTFLTRTARKLFT